MANTTFTQGVLDSYSAWQNPDGVNFLTALAQMFEQSYWIVMDQGDPDNPAAYQPGYSSLLDPDACPTIFLPFLAQFNGTNVQPGTDDAAARAKIKAESAMQRGTPAAIVAAAKNYLTGTQYAYLNERTAANGTPDPYHAVLTVHTQEVGSNMPLLTAAVEAQKPAGIQITYVASTGQTWLTTTGTWSSQTKTWQQSI